MNIKNLPLDLNINSQCELQIFDYHITTNSIKNKVAFNSNAFSFLLEGTKELVAHDKSTTINKDVFLLVKSGNFLMTESLSKMNFYRSVLFFFDDTILIKLLERKNIQIKSNFSSNPYEIFRYDDYIRDFVKSLLTIKEYDDSFKNDLLQAKFEEILIYLLHRDGPDFFNKILPYESNQIRNFTTIINNNKLKNLTIQELSFLCNMSVSTFKRNFEMHYNMSPIKWFQEKRLEHSVYLLVVKKKRPIDIYTEIGFESLSSFTQAFKAKYNSTPKQFQIEKLNV